MSTANDFIWKNTDVLAYAKQYKFSSGRVTVKDFIEDCVRRQEVSNDKDYRILECGYAQTNNGSPDQQYITKVLRKSDNEVFSIGEEVDTQFWRKQIIIGFNTERTELVVEFETCVNPLSKIHKLYNSSKANDYEVLRSTVHPYPKPIEITSVKRLSDGGIFKVGDFTGAGNKIISFKPNPKGFLSVSLEDCTKRHRWGTNLISIKKSKPVLFTTEDGVEIREGDKYFYIDHDWDLGDFTGNKYTVLDGYKTFSTEKAREEYVINNKPCLSYQDIKNTFSETHLFETTWSRLKKVIKEKIK